ncbi:MAG: hypothetical protein WD737_00175 [Gemmatimonadota bacterium]
MLAYLLLGVATLTGLLMIPFGWPGIWLQVGTIGLFGWATEFDRVGLIPLALLFFVALIAELCEPTFTGGRMDAGIRRRTGFGGLAGGSVGAALGLQFPLLGSMFGALAGALVGALLAAFTGGSGQPGGSGRLRLAGQAAAMGVRTAAGITVAAFTLLTLTR